MSTSPRLAFTLWDETTFDADVPNNDNLMRFEAYLNVSVVSATTIAQPALTAPADNGKLYILPTGKTGTNWAARAVGDIAQFYEGVWYFYTPKAFTIARAVDTGVIWAYTTAWVQAETLLGALGAALASAATVTLANATGDYVHITGGVAITSFGTAKTGLERTLVHDAAHVLTHSANIINLTGANITTAAGDISRWRNEGGTVWRMIAYQRATGQPLVVGTAAMEYKGAWNASTNTPTLVNGTGNSGDQYRVSVAGTQNLGAGSVVYDVGDVLTYNATTLVWDHAPSGDDPVGVTDRYGVYLDLGDVSGAVNLDLSAAEVFRLRLVGNTTFAFTNLPPAGRVATPDLIIIQDGTGGRTVTWPASGIWPLGIAHVVSATAGDQDYVGMKVLSSGAWRGFPVEDMA